MSEQSVGQLTIKDRLITWSVCCLARALSRTLRVSSFGEEPLDSLQAENGEALILCGWHGGTFIPITRYRGRGYWAMISTSRDGNRQNHLFHRFGFRTVRGSTSARGAVESVITMRRELKKGGVLAHTPDGPRGPRGVVHPGAIYIAQKANCPLLPAGVSAWPRWNLSTWDRYIVPKPFSKGVIVYGQPLRVPSDLDDDGRREFALYLAEVIQQIQDSAEEFVRSGVTPPRTPPVPWAEWRNVHGAERPVERVPQAQAS